MNKLLETESGLIAITCRLCGFEQSAQGLDLGLQPISNRFKDQASDSSIRYPVQIAQCFGCGLVQLARTAPPDEMRPRQTWMRYREREDHLDVAVTMFRPFLAEVMETCPVVGVTDFDSVFALRLSTRLSLNYTQLSPSEDLEIPHDTFGMETFQRALTPERGKRFAHKHGKARVMVSRYLLEHAEKPALLLEAYREILDEGGFLILEVPDAEAPLNRKDYLMIWEEHFSYFTETTLRGALEANGFSIRSVMKAASRFEQPMLILAQKVGNDNRRVIVPDSEVGRFRKFCDLFAARRIATREFCKRSREAGRNIVLFGAGHFSVAFVSLFGLEEFITCVIDDDPNKAGLFLPGSLLPIFSSSHLGSREPVLVLLCVNPDVEARVMEKLKVLIPNDESCYSIFADSPRFFLNA